MIALGQRLTARLRRLGAITIAEYMAEVLAHPEGGYYMSGDPFGAHGDFTTAPEISQMFGELIGLWCADTWQRLDRPKPMLLVELGPGRGTLIADALRAATVAPGFLEAIQLHLVEISPSLRTLQRDALMAQSTGQSSGLTPTWHDSLATIPEGPVLLIANEFFDALPIRQFDKRAEGWCERLVTLAADGETLVFASAPSGSPTAVLIPPEVIGAPEGAVVEVCAPAVTIAGEIGRRLVAHGGAALIIDYGHREPRTGATLQAVRNHAVHPVLQDPGTADLTAHVDFAALARAAVDAGARAHGPVAQGQFLQSLGIGARAEALRRTATPQQAEAVASAFDRLISPQGMGELFQVLAITDSTLAPPAGFADQESGQRETAPTRARR